MAVHNILPAENLSVNDIADTLIAGGGKLPEGVSSWHDTRALFTSEANINPFSKYKPIVRAVNFCQDFDSTKPNYMKDWWKGADGWCGFTPKQLDNYKRIPEHCDGDWNGWSYTIPQGGESAPMRLGDFRKYSYKAPSFFGNEMDIPPFATRDFNYTSFVVRFNEESHADGLWLKISDLPNLSLEDASISTFYLGLIAVHADDPTYYTGLTADSVTDREITVLTRYMDKDGVWNIYPFLSQHRLPQDRVEEIVSKVFTIPKIRVGRITIVDKTFKIEITTATINSLYEVRWVAKITNYSASPKTLTSNRVYLRFVENAGNIERLELGEKDNTIEDVTIEAFGEKVIEGSFITTAPAVSAGGSAKDYWLGVYLDGGTYKGEANVTKI